MGTETSPTQVSLKWLRIWQTAFFHPTIQTFSRIMDDPKASIKRSIIWVAITMLLVWLVGPQRIYWWGMVANTFGFQAASYFVAIGAIVAPLLGVIAFLINAAMAHGLARLFDGQGTFRKLVYCWGVMQLPFIFASWLAFNIPWNMYVYLRRLFSPGASPFSMTYVVMAYLSLFMAAIMILYLLYAQIVAFSAVEKFGIGKGLGILMLLGLVLGIASAFLSSGLQALVMRSLGY